MLENLRSLLELLNKSKISYCVIGGVAILFYGGRSSTIDFDLYILTSEKKKLLRIFEANQVKWELAGDFQIKAKFGIIPLDILIADKWVGKYALKRSRMISFETFSARVASPEDIVIMKTIADRPVDRRDIEELRELFNGKLDEKYIERRLRVIDRELKS